MALRTTTAANTFDVTPATGDRLFIKHALTSLAGDFGTSPAMDAAGTGTVSASGTTTLTGSGTAFTTQLGVGYLLKIGTGPAVAVVEAIASDTSLTLNAAVTVSGAAFTFTPMAIYQSGSGASVAVSGALTVRGPWAVHDTGGSLADVVTVAAGAGIEFDAAAAPSPSSTHYPFALKLATGQLTRLRLDGTSGSRAYLRSNSGGGNAYLETFGTSTGGFLYGRYADFTRIGTASLLAYDIAPVAGQPSFDIEQCIFDGCGLVTGDNRLSNGSASTTIGVVNCTWRNSLVNPCVALPPGPTGSAFTWKGNVTDRDVNIQAYNWTIGGPGADDWCLAEGPTGFDTNGHIFSPGAAGFRHVFKRKTHNNDDFACLCTTEDCYFLADMDPGQTNLHPCPLNSRFPHDLLRCVHEAGPSDPESDFIQTPASAGTWNVRYGIKIPNSLGYLTGTFTFGAADGVTVNIEHCTFHLGGNPDVATGPQNATGGIALGEGYPGHSGMVKIKGCLFWDQNPTPSDSVVSSLPGVYPTLAEDCIVPADISHNAIHNAITGDDNTVAGATGQSLFASQRVKWSSAPTPSVTTEDPQFVWQVQGKAATELGLAGWAASLGATGTLRERLDHALAQMRKKNDPTGYDSRYNLPALLAYVRDLHRPTNPAYAGLTSAIDDSGLTDAAGNDLAGTPGAMALASTAPPLDLTGFDSFLTWSRTTTGKIYPADYLAADYLGNPVDTIGVPNAEDHYDSVRVYQNIRDYTGDSSWETEIRAAVDRYTKGGSISFGGFKAFDAESLGLARHHRETGEALSRAAVCQMRGFEQFVSGNPPLTGGATYWRASREQAFGILHALNAEDLGYPSGSTIHGMAANAVGHLIQWSPPGVVFGDPGYPFFLYVRPFFVGLVSEALIAYWDRYRDHPDCPPDIPATIKRALDWIWANNWMPDQQCLAYTDHETDGPGYTTNLGPFTVSSVSSNGVFSSADATLSTADNSYWSGSLRFETGALTGYSDTVAGYAGSTKTITLLDPPGSPPAVGDQFILYTPDRHPDIPGDGDTGGRLESTRLSLMTAPAYAWYYWYTAAVLGTPDTTYRDRHDDLFNGSSCVVSGGTGLGSHKEFNQTYRWTFDGFRWRERGSSPPPAATALSWTAPDGLTTRANEWSGRIRIGLAGSNVTLPGPVALTLTDTLPGGASAGGSVRWSGVISPDRPYAVLNYRPAAGTAGQSITLALSAPGLTSPTPLTCTVSGTAPIATGYTFTGPSSGPVGVDGAPFTVALTPANSVLPASEDHLAGYLYIDITGHRATDDDFHNNAVNDYRLNGWPVRGSYHVPLDGAIGSHTATFPGEAGTSRLYVANYNGWADPVPYTAPLNYTAPPPATGRRLRIALAGGRRFRLRLGS